MAGSPRREFFISSDSLVQGGSERQLYNLLQGMDRERYRPGVIVWDFRENDFYVSKIRALGVPLVVRQSHGFFVPKQLFVVRNGINLDLFRQCPIPDRNTVIILGVGSLHAVKRWDRLLVAARELKARGLDFLIRIVGDGPLGPSLKESARELGVSDCVEIFGPSSDVPALLSEADFLVHPSSIEGCPNVVLEAMACGRAVVSCDAGDASLVIENGKTGFVVNQGDDRALIESMATLVVDRHLALAMGKAGRTKAEREFGLTRLVSQTLNAYTASGWKDDIAH